MFYGLVYGCLVYARKSITPLTQLAFLMRPQCFEWKFLWRQTQAVRSIKNYSKSRGNFHVKNINSRAISGFQLSPNLFSASSGRHAGEKKKRNSKTNKFIMRTVLCAEAPNFSSWESVAINQIPLFSPVRFALPSTGEERASATTLSPPKEPTSAKKALVRPEMCIN